MSHDNNSVDLSLAVAGEGVLRKKIRSIIESITPVPGVPLFVERSFKPVEQRRYNGVLFFSPGQMVEDWVTFVRKHGGPLAFARNIVGEEDLSLLRSWLKRQRSEARHQGLQTDFCGKFASISSIVYGQVNNLIAAREQEAKANGLSEAFKAVFETTIARKAYGADAESHLQPDWDRMSEYTDVGPKSRGLYLGRMFLDPGNAYHQKAAKASNSQHMLGRWVIDIRYSGWYLKKVAKPQLDELLSGLEKAFVPAALLGKGFAIYDQQELAQFQDRFYNRPSELIWRKIGTGKARRWSVWFQTANGWLWAPLTHKSSKKVDRNSKGNSKAYDRKVYRKGDRWISARVLVPDTVHKDGSWTEALLLVTVSKTVIADIHHRPKLLREVSQHTTPFCSPAVPAGPFQGPVIPLTKKGKPRKTKLAELVFSQPRVEKRKQVQVIKEVTMGLQEWGQKIKELIKQGWTAHEV